jgi:hypothetical protein
MNYLLEIPIRSEVCLTPGNCYPVNTYLPSWLMIGLIALTFLTVKNSIK